MEIGNNNQNLKLEYPDFFKQHKNTKGCEKLFFDLSGVTLKDFLSQKYVTEGLTPKEIASIFGCSYSTIYLKLKFYKLNRNCHDAKIVARKRKIRIGEYNKTPTDIETETGRKFLDIIVELTNQGLSPSEIARELKLSNQTYIRQFIKKDEYKTIEVLYPNIFKNKRSLEENEKIFYETTGKNLKDFLYQKYVTEKFSTYKISPLFGCDASTIYKKLKYYGFSRNLKEARDILIKNGEIDYAKISWKRRQTSKKSLANSNNQDMALEILKSKFEFHLINSGIKNLEIVVGYNDWCIIPGKEVDIPIIIFDLENGNVYKFSIEYNGCYWHQNKNKSDTDKGTFLHFNGWTHKIILDNLSNHKIEIEIENVVNEIIDSTLSERKTFNN